MEEYKFQFLIVPETYDYGEEEITYRIFFDEQLISERSLPILSPNQGIFDNFIVKIDKQSKKKILFQNILYKKSIVKKIIINEIPFDNINGHIQIKGLTVFINSI